MARLKPRLQALARKGNGGGAGDPDDVEAQLPRPVRKGALECLAGPIRRCRMIRANSRFRLAPVLL